MEEKGLIIRKTAIALPDEAQFRHDIQAINSFQKIVRATMVEGLDYGVIPGTDKPTLLKPGAEKMAKLLQLSDSYEIMEKTEDWDKPLFYYQIKCSLKTIGDGILVSEGVGSCNSMEARYRWRQAKRKCPTCGVEAIIEGKKEWGGGYICFKKQGGCGAKFLDGDPQITSQKVGRVANDDIYSQVNTILKLAKKRALVDASLSAGRLSDIFTQDIEEMPNMPPMRAPDANSETVEGEVVQPGPSPADSAKMKDAIDDYNADEATKVASETQLNAQPQASVTQGDAVPPKPVVSNLATEPQVREFNRLKPLLGAKFPAQYSQIIPEKMNKRDISPIISELTALSRAK